MKQMLGMDEQGQLTVGSAGVPRTHLDWLRRMIATMCWTLLTVGLSTGAVVLWRGGSLQNETLKIGGLLLLAVAVIVAALVG
jgi:hypothetical protein